MQKLRDVVPADLLPVCREALAKMESDYGLGADGVALFIDKRPSAIERCEGAARPHMRHHPLIDRPARVHVDVGPLRVIAYDARLVVQMLAIAPHVFADGDTKREQALVASLKSQGYGLGAMTGKMRGVFLADDTLALSMMGSVPGLVSVPPPNLVQPLKAAARLEAEKRTALAELVARAKKDKPVDVGAAIAPIPDVHDVTAEQLDAFKQAHAADSASADLAKSIKAAEHELEQAILARRIAGTRLLIEHTT